MYLAQAIIQSSFVRQKLFYICLFWHFFIVWFFLFVFLDFFSVSFNKGRVFMFQRGIFVPLPHFVDLNFDAPSALRINQYHKILKILFYVTLIS